MRISTEQLLNLATNRDDVVEAAIIHGAFRATHWICPELDKFWHEGIDGEEEIIIREAFIALYPNTVWMVEA